MILTVGNTKGGVGKSTIALQLAIGLSLDGGRVWLVDGDRQKTALSAITARADTGRPMIAASGYTDGPTLRAQVMQQREHFDHIVIDAGGRDSTALRGALTVSDAVLIPFAPRSFDVWALQDMQELVIESRSVADLQAVAFVNKADPQGKENREAADALAEYPALTLIDLLVTNRKVFADASGAGLHVEEMKRRNTVACAEIDRLKNAVLRIGATA